MATMAFLFAPDREIPQESDESWRARAASWISMTTDVWEELRERLPEEERRSLPGDLPYRNVSSNASGFTERSNPELRKASEEWVKQVYQGWTASGGTASLPAIDPQAFAEATGTPSRISLQNLTAYRGNYAAIPRSKLKRGGSIAVLASKGNLFEYEFGPGQVEHTVFQEIVRAHGGEALAVWTYGRAFHVLHASASDTGRSGLSTRQFSLRLTPPPGGRRTEALLEELRSRFTDSAFRPDWERLAGELDSPEASVESLFLVFGLPGAQEILPRDAQSQWNALERTCDSLLRGDEVPKEDLKTVNALLAVAGGDLKLRAKASKPGSGATARQVAEAFRAFCDSLGEPPAGTWTSRRSAARFYGAIAGSSASDQLSSGRDKAGFGGAASLARLLAYYPPAVRRDPVFLALAALECEAENGHSFVEPLLKLAEAASTAALTVAVFPAPLQAKFRKAFGIEGGPVSTKGTEWDGEAFVDSPVLTRTSLMEKLRDWFGAQRAGGFIVCLQPDGSGDPVLFLNGAAEENGSAEALGLRTPDMKVRQSATTALDAPALFTALGLPHLLQPVSLHEAPEEASSVAAVRAQQPFVAQTLDSLPDATPLAAPADLLRFHLRDFRYVGPKSSFQDGITSLRLTFPGGSTESLLPLRLDLANLIRNYGAVWISGEDTIHAFSRTSTSPAALAALLGDCPPGTGIAISIGGERKHRYCVTGEALAAAPSADAGA